MRQPSCFPPLCPSTPAFCDALGLLHGTSLRDAGGLKGTLGTEILTVSLYLGFDSPAAAGSRVRPADPMRCSGAGAAPSAPDSEEGDQGGHAAGSAARF